MEIKLNQKLIVPVLALMLVLLACSVQINTTETPASAITDTSIPPVVVSITETPTLYLPAPVSELSEELLRNGTYDLPAFTGTPRTVTLVNGSYASSTDPAAVDYISVSMSDLVAFGDLNYDSFIDAAVILGINTGGTGTFIYIAAVLDRGGSPVHVASVYIDDRAFNTSLAITSGEILSDILIHGVDGPLCCPSFQTRQGFRLFGSQLLLTRFLTWTTGVQRAINIDSPADLDDVNYPFTISGSVSIGPFENTLAYAIYTSDNTLVTNGSVMTASPNPGDPGSFSLPLDLSMAGVYGLVRIEFAEISMMDGSVMTLDSVLVKVH